MDTFKKSINMKKFLSIMAVAVIAITGCKQPTPTQNNLKNILGFNKIQINKYNAMAAQAEKDSMPQIAAYFKALAASDSVINSKFVALAAERKVQDTLSKHPVELKSTNENFAEAVLALSVEISSMYPAYIDQAKKDNDTVIVKLLEAALKIKEAQSQVQSLTGDAAAQFGVCTVCGNVLDMSKAPETCPICGESKEKFKLFR